MVDLKLSIVAREVCKNTGKIATYLCKKDVNDRDIHLASIRSRINPELRYFAIRTCDAESRERLEKILSLLKQKNLSERMVESYGGIVRL